MPENANPTNPSGSNGANPSSSGNGAEPGGGSNPTPTTPSRPEPFADARFDKFWDANEGLKHADVAGELNRLTSFEAEQNIKRASLPENPDAYKLELPNGFQLPDGVKWEFDDKDPRIPEVRKLAHELGLDQGGFARLIGIHVQHELQAERMVNDAREAEIKKLGANGSQRVTALGTWLTAQLGEKQGKALLDRMVFSEDIEAMENIVKKFSSQGAAPFSGSHRSEPDPAPKSFAQRLLPKSTAQLNAKAS